MARFSLQMFSLNRLSRKAVLGIAAALAVTGATGAAALLAPGDLGLSQFIPAVSAQAVPGSASDDPTFNQFPFERIAQTPAEQQEEAPSSGPTFGQQPLPTNTATPDSSRRFVPTADAPAARAPLGARTPLATRAPLAQAPTTEPKGFMVPTASPGFISQPKPVAQTKFVTPVKKIATVRPVHICND